MNVIDTSEIKYSNRAEYIREYCKLYYRAKKDNYQARARIHYRENKEIYIDRAKTHYRLNSERHKLLTVLNRRAKRLMTVLHLEERVQ